MHGIGEKRREFHGQMNKEFKRMNKHQWNSLRTRWKISIGHFIRSGPWISAVTKGQLEDTIGKWKAQNTVHETSDVKHKNKIICKY